MEPIECLSPQPRVRDASHDFCMANVKPCKLPLAQLVSVSQTLPRSRVGADPSTAKRHSTLDRLLHDRLSVFGPVHPPSQLRAAAAKARRVSALSLACVVSRRCERRCYTGVSPDLVKECQPCTPFKCPLHMLLYV
jgi:hypothetical protein